MKLPKTYSLKIWERGGKNPDHEKFIGLPSLSWSQIEKWHNVKSKSFSKVDGITDYILDYFMGIDLASDNMKIYGDFGTEVEGYICERKYCEKFSDTEKKVLDRIKILGEFQKEIVIDFGEFVVLGYIDDYSPVLEGFIAKVRDYKTKSESSKKDLHNDTKLQLPLYVGALEQRGLKVGGAEYCIIERKELKSLYKGGTREDLVVGTQVWYEDFVYDQSTIDKAFGIVKETAKEISEYYEVYLHLNKK